MSDTASVSVAPHPRRFSFDSLAIWALTLSAAAAAIAFVPVATIPFVYTKVSIIALGGLVALVLFVLARLSRGNIIVPPIALVGALWLVPAAYALSTLFSGVGGPMGTFGTELEVDTFGFMLILASFGTLAALIFRRTNHYRTFFMVGAVALAVIEAVQLIFLVLAKIMPQTIAGSANLVGSFMDLGMLVGLGITLILIAARFLPLSSRVKLGLWVTGGFGLFILALVNSPLIWTLVALAALGLFIEAIMRRRVRPDEDEFDGVAMIDTDREHELGAQDARELGAPLVVLVIALFFLIGGTIGAALSNALGTSYLDVRPSWQSTFSVGSHTYAASPLFGSGPGTFGTQWLKFRDRSLNETIFWNVDFTSGIGLIPTSFVTTGIVGALAWLAFLGLFLVIGLRSLLFRAPEDTYARFAAVASYVGALFVIVLSIFAVPGPVVLLTGFLLIGIFISSLRYGGSRREWGIVFAKNPRVGFVIVFLLTIVLLASVVAAYVVIERYLSSVAYAQSSQALARGDLPKAAEAINRSLIFAPSDRAYQLVAAIGIAEMNKIANDTTLTPSQAQQQFQTALSTSIQAATTATRLNPNHYQNWAMLGNVYQTVVPLNINGAYENAKTAYAQAQALNPSSPTIPFVMAQLEIAQKNYAAAEENLTTAIGLKRDYTEAIFLLSQLAAQQGKAEEALQAAEAAAYFAPTDPNVLFQVGILRSANGDVDGSIQALEQAVAANNQYANARFFLAVGYAQKRDFQKALEQLQAVAAFSEENAQAVAADIAALQAGRNPFPASRLGALGIPQPGLTDHATSTRTTR